jgi:hypothetical protein
MFIVINNIKELEQFLSEKGITTPSEIVEVLADKDILVSPDIAALIMEAA